MKRLHLRLNTVFFTAMEKSARRSKKAASSLKNSDILKEEPKPVKTYFSPKASNTKHVKIEYDLDAKKEPLKKVTSHFFTKPESEVKKEATSPNKRSLKKNIEKPEEKGHKQIKWEPKNWKETLENIKIMRKERDAPVDIYGCKMCAEVGVDEKTKRFHILIALMLSSQTKDQVIFDAMERLKKIGLTPENIVKVDDNSLEKLIFPVGFYKNKTKYIKKTSLILISEYQSDIPNTIEGLMKLPGVGPKMAFICMRESWNQTLGIGVDTHVHRISNRLHWVTEKDPEKTRIALENWLPFEHWDEINILMVGFGQTICTPTHPKCNICINNEICPSRVMKKK